MHRFYIENFSAQSSIVLKDNEISHQIITVLRAKVGDTFVLFDGKHSTDYVYQISDIKRKKEITLIGKDVINKKKDQKQISLYQALPNKLEKLEYIIQKGVEVGITGFYFFRSERSQALFLSPSKKMRLQKIMIEAVEQSRRNILPSLEFIPHLSDISGNVVFFHTEQESAKTLSEFSQNGTSVSLLVGPEGGWTQEEVKTFILQGYKKVYLGTGILRTETVSSVVAFFLSQI